MTRLRVLVVDDSTTSRDIFVEMLRGWGLAAVGLSDAHSALDAISQAHEAGESFGLVLLDARMPLMDGPALVRRLRSAPRFPHLPVILLTTSGAQPERTADLTDVVWLMKPIARSHLLEAIESIAGIRPGSDRTPVVAPAETRKRLRILVAEDNAVNRKVVVRMLEKRGHQVVAVVDGQEAISAIEAPFDLVLMDVQMPLVNGIDATIAIRERERFTGGHLPIVALTAHAMKGDRERCLAAGMDAYVSKPVEAAPLFATIEALGSAPREMPARPAPKVEGDGDADGVLDYAALNARVDDDNDLLVEVLEDFRRDSGSLVDQLRQAIDCRDNSGIAQVAHTLKGALATITANAASDAAAQLYQHARNGDVGRIDDAWTQLEREMIRLQAELEARSTTNTTPSARRSA